MNTEDSQHPSLFNPFTWGSGGPPGQPKLFPHSDLRRAVTRYSGTQSDYNDPFFSVMPQSPPTNLTGFGLQSPSNINRALDVLEMNKTIGSLMEFIVFFVVLVL